MMECSVPPVPGGVNADRRRARSARTEERIVRAATELMLDRGYARTSLTDVAAAAGVSPRTLYVRFATKPELLKRMIDVAVVGDVDEVPLAERPWVCAAFGAPTLDERITALAGGVAEMHARLAPLVALAIEVENAEPVIAEQAARARAGNHGLLQGFWSALVRDGLVDADTDVEHVAASTMLLSAAETAVLRRRSFGEETPGRYAEWLAGALRAFAREPQPKP